MQGARKAQKRRSKGCEACRKGKVKCGEERPQCRRCTRQEIPCLYPDPLDVDFRNENDKAALRAVTMWRQRATIVESQDHNAVTLPSLSADPTTHLYFNLNSEDLPTRALAIFLQDFGCMTRRPIPWMGFFQMLPSLHAKISGPSSFSHAIQAVSLAHHARKRRVPSSAILARTEYRKAIELVYLELHRLNGLPTAEILVSICLMSLFETLVSGSINDGNTSRLTHIHGAIAVLQQVDPGKFEPAIDNRLLNAIYFQMVIICLGKKLRPPFLLQLWTNRLNPLLHGPQLFSLMYRVAELQADIDLAMKHARRSDPQTWDKLNYLIGAMQETERELKIWESRLPSQFSARDVSSKDHFILGLPGAPRTVYAYKTLWIAVPLVFGFALRVIINWNLLEYNILMSEKEPESKSCSLHSAAAKETIVEMVHNICRSVTTMLSTPTTLSDEYEKDVGNTRGLFMAWPLTVALTSLKYRDVFEEIGLQTALWLADVLRYTHQLVGVEDSPLRDGFENFPTMIAKLSLLSR